MSTIRRLIKSIIKEELVYEKSLAYHDAAGVEGLREKQFICRLVREVKGPTLNSSHPLPPDNCRIFQALIIKAVSL